ncbi:protein AGENET DOMAIN (AGD)-CONTAINING P1-like [Lotus japonicus]|uniref:protein AGENET DOMAIN (AGD)-CONTAINING P1-like n=1 Tax=Lotus japonicus TaxID=34305 RepID=UPI0025860969|nr:protein AGENET DOMAIN (AGD)-CONTAINING P1-like [Lotus japonicus]
MSTPPRVYTPGNRVEVMGYEPGFIGSYYEATILTVLDDGRYEVIYKNLVEDEETKIPLKEYLRPQDLRPRPPPVREAIEFKLTQHVDVFINEGWWIGAVAAKDMDRSVYLVYFESTGKAAEYDSSLVRVHQELINGLWYRSDP